MYMYRLKGATETVQAPGWLKGWLAVKNANKGLVILTSDIEVSYDGGWKWQPLDPPRTTQKGA